jgi:outer membrane protein OmpA-like peptidoglycan-associated protein
VKTFGLLAAGAILALTAPVSAQLVGGGLGGSLGGSLGGLGGSGAGSLRGTLNRPQLDTRAVDRAARARVREERRAARAPADQNLIRATDLAGQPRALDGAADSSGSLGATGSHLASSARASTGEPSVEGGANGRFVVDPMLRTRGAVAAAQRGMRRVTATASGVPVFVPRAVVAAPVVVSQRRARVYPGYSEVYHYGGAAPFVIHETEIRTYMDRQQREFERGLAGTGATVRRQGDDLIVALPADVTFAFDKADIRPRFYSALSAFARTLNAYPGTDVEVAGHTDSVGSETYNLGLSERRGRAVAEYLVSAGTEPVRLVVEALGESEPIASNATVDGRAANRRVELIVHPRAG